MKWNIYVLTLPEGFPINLKLKININSPLKLDGLKKTAKNYQNKFLFIWERKKFTANIFL